MTQQVDLTGRDPRKYVDIGIGGPDLYENDILWGKNVPRFNHMFLLMKISPILCL